MLPEAPVGMLHFYQEKPGNAIKCALKCLKAQKEVKDHPWGFVLSMGMLDFSVGTKGCVRSDFAQPLADSQHRDVSPCI